MMNLFEMIALVVIAYCAGVTSVLLCIRCIAAFTRRLDGQRADMTDKLMSAYFIFKQTELFFAALSVLAAVFLSKTITSASFWAMGISAIISALVFVCIFLFWRPGG